MNELLSSGIELMLIGMVIVYAFLTMLVLAINMMSYMVQRFFPEKPNTHLPMGQQVDDPGVLAAISAAIHQYRKKYPKL